MKTKRYYIAGVWDLFHVGHLNAIKRARAIAGKNTLIVGVVTDQHALAYKGVLPVIPFKERRSIIKALKYPDSVVDQEVQFSIDHMKRLGIDEVLLGEDWKEKMPDHLKAMMQHVKVTFLKRTEGVSSSMIKEKIIARVRQ